jgi:hypothetical protein
MMVHTLVGAGSLMATSRYHPFCFFIKAEFWVLVATLYNSCWVKADPKETSH